MESVDDSEKEIAQDCYRSTVMQMQNFLSFSDRVGGER